MTYYNLQIATTNNQHGAACRTRSHNNLELTSCVGAPFMHTQNRSRQRYRTAPAYYESWVVSMDSSSKSFDRSMRQKNDNFTVWWLHQWNEFQRTPNLIHFSQVSGFSTFGSVFGTSFASATGIATESYAGQVQWKSHIASSDFELGTLKRNHLILAIRIANVDLPGGTFATRPTLPQHRQMPQLPGAHNGWQSLLLCLCWCLLGRVGWHSSWLLHTVLRDWWGGAGGLSETIPGDNLGCQ